MNIPFTKYQGTGNDFVMINGFQDAGIMFKLNSRRIKTLCDRHFGIGADGLIILAPDKDLDFQMLYYNSDGQPSSMCGNGGRCIADFAYRLRICGQSTRFNAVDGEHEARIGEQVSLKMNNVDYIEEVGGDLFLDTGSPHYIHFTENLENPEFVAEARRIRNSPSFSEKGVNVNFVMRDGKKLRMRTYERGVEDETLSCGTGVVAASIACHVRDPELGNEIRVIAPGGELEVKFKTSGGRYSDIWLTGPVAEVFQGVISLAP